ncbi:hypothetical protein RB195_021384 [Necator americanus]|uniref:BPTI/Kunitz inhibitor domain-containing protein n=1 Tax=Necator americanus TaxID=51031 RepID=A0ABR1EAQ8_NECAM
MKFVLFLLFCSLILVGNGKRCLLPIQEGPCRALIQRWAYNTTLRSCFEFFYGGCRGNRNNFVDKKGCEQRVEKKIKRQSEIRQFEFIVEEYTFIDHSLFGRLE